MGTFAVQMAKALGAQVTATTTADKVELVRSLGAVEVLDYRKVDYTRRGKQYDLIFDLGASRPLKESRQALKPHGSYVMVGSPKVTLLWFIGRILRLRLMSRKNGQHFFSYITRGKDEDLVVLKDLLASGRIRSVIDRTFPLPQVPEAIAYAATARASGKVVIRVS